MKPGAGEALLQDLASETQVGGGKLCLRKFGQCKIEAVVHRVAKLERQVQRSR